MEIDENLAQCLGNAQKDLLAAALDRKRTKALLSDIGTLVKADAAIGAWLDGGRPWLETWRAGSQVGDYLRDTFACVDSNGNIRAHDPDLDRVNLNRRRLGSGIHHERALDRRDRIESARYHREAFAPAGMHHVIYMTTRLVVGEALFAFGYDDGDVLAANEARIRTLLTLLFPAFEHGFQAIDQRALHRERFEKALAESDLPIHILDGQSPPPADSLLTLPLPKLTLNHSTPSYLAVAAPKADQLAARLARQFGLTERQETTAALLLAGRTTGGIAAMLGVSMNTARRHCEAVLNKTGAGQRHRLAIIAAGQASD